MRLSLPPVGGECRRSEWASSAPAISMLWQANHSQCTRWGSVGNHRGCAFANSWRAGASNLVAGLAYGRDFLR